jgi:16S rRNA (cytosine1402-N4)-methyltransferase
MLKSILQEQPLPHIPVMLLEVLEYLNPQKDGIYIDGTIGAGGHAMRIIGSPSSSRRVIGLDRDAEALEICKNQFGASARFLTTHRTSYHQFPKIMHELGVDVVNGILLDLGLSSMQLNSPSRGFAFESEGNLDMRFNKDSGKTASDLINQSTEEELANIIYNFGEERHSRKIAYNIKNMKKMTAVADLKEAIRRSTPPHKRKKSLARVFQALRIAVNNELDKLELFLSSFIDYLTINGRVVIISYHSIEDRMVKHAFRKLKNDQRLKQLTKKPIIPTKKEQEQNSRSRSAKLRAIERII